ncbi:MAG: right-handed parallel beta-helix repeat-containing protein, partial [Planctomycetota bacterium]
MNRTSLTLAAAVVLILFSTSHLPAAEIHVPADESTIQGAIDLALPGDVVVVAPGTYFEALDFAGKAIEVRSSGGAAVTTLDGSSLTVSIVTFDSGEGPDSVLDGFTLTQGQGTVIPGFSRRGLAIRIENSSPVIRSCVASDNGLTVVTDGGAVHCSNSSALIEDCQFVNNTATAAGAIYIGDASVVRIERCSFENCTTTGFPGFNAGAIASIQNSTTTVIDCRFEECSCAPGGSGGAIFSSSGSLGGPPNLMVVNSLFVGNS